jgi:hypothetical protein
MIKAFLSVQNIRDLKRNAVKLIGFMAKTKVKNKGEGWKRKRVEI